jgi:hypothetical protein
MDPNGNQQPARCPAGWTCVDASGGTGGLWACEQ